MREELKIIRIELKKEKIKELDSQIYSWECTLRELKKGIVEAWKILSFETEEKKKNKKFKLTNSILKKIVDDEIKKTLWHINIRKHDIKILNKEITELEKDGYI